jgi:hypothetical protein
MERLAPAVMLVLFDGIPAVVHIEEPRQGIQFGVRLTPSADDPNRLQAGVKARDAKTALDVNNNPNDLVPVPFRRGTPGVLDIKKLNEALLAKPGTNMGPPSTAPSSRCRCCASRIARCSATRTSPPRRRSSTSSGRRSASPSSLTAFTPE